MVIFCLNDYKNHPNYPPINKTQFGIIPIKNGTKIRAKPSCFFYFFERYTFVWIADYHEI